ncbi:MAG TPA: hypothetical protein VJL90_08190, partial [Pseudorhodoplanes sp.]|nr:hypothetical protein [Pseudorhodoplanes sp.]
NVWDWMWGAEQNPELASDVPGLCDSYADKAVAAAATNISNACGRGGPRYSTDRNVHYWWCMASRAESVSAEDTNRGAEMSKCSYCRNYADKIPAKVREARLYSCNLTGPRWAPDPEDHFRWCFGSADSMDGPATSEDQQRNIEVALCKDRYTTAQLTACETYAGKAVEQAKGNARLRCGDTGPLWTQDWDAHFMFCTSTTRNNPNGVGDVIASQQATRDKRNNFCALATTRRKDLPTTATTKQLSGGGGKSDASAATAKPASPAATSSAMDRLGDSPRPSVSGQPKTQDAGRLRAPASAGTAAQPSSSASPELFRQGPFVAPPAPKPLR